VSGRGPGPKTLLPELLPAPRPEAAAAPRERVIERARLLIARFRGLPTVAGAAVLGLQCSGYGVVDPLPPPAQQCSASPDPFAALTIRASFDTFDTPDAAVPLPPVAINILSYTTTGYQIGDVRVTNGTLVSVQSLPAYAGPGTMQFLVKVAPDTATSVLLVDIDIGCGTATITKHYRISYYLPASNNDVVVLEEVHDG